MNVTEIPKTTIEREPLMDLRFVSRQTKGGQSRAMLQQRHVVREMRGGWCQKESYEWRDVPFVVEEPVRG